MSTATLRDLRVIRNCELVLIRFLLGAGVIIVVTGDKEDRPTGFVMCLFVMMAASGVAFASTKAARNLRITLSRTGKPAA